MIVSVFTVNKELSSPKTCRVDELTEQASCSTCGLRLWAQALCRTVQVRIRVNEYTPPHTPNKVARFARFYKLD
jgi:hypothetical protein